jgi:cytochrome P450
MYICRHSYYLQVVREVLRVYSPAVYLKRMAMQDDVLPLGKPYVDKSGKSYESLPYVPSLHASAILDSDAAHCVGFSLRISKGQMIHLPILAINTDPEIWGEDAAEFK